MNDRPTTVLAHATILPSWMAPRRRCTKSRGSCRRAGHPLASRRASPTDLDRRRPARLPDARNLRPPAEAAAGQHSFQLHLLRLEAEDSSNGLVLPGLELATEARQRLLAVPAQIAVEGLHRRVREVGKSASITLSAQASAASASPCVPATVPGWRDSERYSSMSCLLLRFSAADSSQLILSFSRPLSAGHMLSA